MVEGCRGLFGPAEYCAESVNQELQCTTQRHKKREASGARETSIEGAATARVKCSGGHMRRGPGKDGQNTRVPCENFCHLHCN